MTGGRGQAGAQFGLRLGEDDVNLVWRDDAEPPGILSRIAIFDSKTSRVFIDEEDEVRFIPYGLDAFARLAQVCGRLKEKLNTELVLHQRASNAPTMEGETAAARLLAELNADCCPIDAAVLSHLTSAETGELEHLREVKGSDPIMRAEVARSIAARVKGLKEKVHALAEAVSADSISALRSISEAVDAAAMASARASGEAFHGEPLDGVGADAWRLMYEAAKRYSEELAYPGKPFPVTEPEAVCVLCQQRLVPPANERMRRFDAYMTDETARIERKKRELLAAALAALSGVEAHPENADASLLSELRKRNDAMVVLLLSECESMRTTRDACIAASASGEWAAVAAPTVTAVGVLSSLSELLEQEAVDADKSADPTERARVLARLEKSPVTPGAVWPDRGSRNCDRREATGARYRGMHPLDRHDFNHPKRRRAPKGSRDGRA